MGLLSASSLNIKIGFSPLDFVGNVSTTGQINSKAGGIHREKESL